MKIYAVLFLFFVLSYKAQNNVRLTAIDGQVFRVKINEVYLNQSPETSVLLENIKTDTLELTIDVPGISTATAIVYLLDKGKPCHGKELNYTVRTTKEKAELRYEGIYEIVPVPNPVVPKKPVVDTLSAWKNRFLGHLCEMKNGEPLYFNNLPKTGPCIDPMPNSYLSFVSLLMKKADVEDDKYRIIENVCRNNCLSAAQLTKLLEYISFEIEKLKLVRTAYFHLTDPGNSKTLESAFRFEASVKELRLFLKEPGEGTASSGTNCKVPADSLEIGVFRNA